VSDLSAFIRDQVLPAVPPHSAHAGDSAYWTARARALGIDFDATKAEVAERQAWLDSSKKRTDHGIDAIERIIGGIKRDQRLLCDKILAEASSAPQSRGTVF